MRFGHPLAAAAVGALLLSSILLYSQSPHLASQAATPAIQTVPQTATRATTQLDPAQAPPAAQAQVIDARQHALLEDFGQLGYYRAANQQLPAPAPGERRVIFYGDSITNGWHLDQYFPGKKYINRGIGGQTTPQMLLRFRQDVIDLQPKVVVLLAGTNDLSSNTGPMTIEQTEENYATLAELARAHNIALVFSSVTPVNNYMRADMLVGRPPGKILALNTWLKNYCQANHLVYLDYFPAMVDAQGMLQKPISNDGLHPNEAGYRIMSPLAQQAVDAALGSGTTP